MITIELWDAQVALVKDMGYGEIVELFREMLVLQGMEMISDGLVEDQDNHPMTPAIKGMQETLDLLKAEVEYGDQEEN